MSPVSAFSFVKVSGSIIDSRNSSPGFVSSMMWLNIRSPAKTRQGVTKEGRSSTQPSPPCYTTPCGVNAARHRAPPKRGHCRFPGQSVYWTQESGVQYRIDKKSGNQLSVLGFGAMRFPKTLGVIDMRKTEELVIRAIAAGVNYFDSAWIWNGCAPIISITI